MDDVTKAVSQFVKDKGFQIKIIAQRTGVSQNVLYNSFSGKRKLRVDEYLTLCDFFGKDPKDFIVSSSNPTTVTVHRPLKNLEDKRGRHK
jgi:hypothetical protein